MLEQQSQFYTYSNKRKSSCILRILLHTLQSAAYFAQPVHSSKRSRSRVRPLNNIRSCCLPLPAKGRATALAINTHISKYARITARHTNAPLAAGMQCDAMYTHETRICIWGMPVTLLENMKTSFLINSRGDRESGIWHARSSHDWHSWLLYSGKRFCQLFTEIQDLWYLRHIESILSTRSTFDA